jgi:hypothetical protein
MADTTHAEGEEDPTTTIFIGEEGESTTAIGEEDTTHAIGEEGGETTDAIGEEEPEIYSSSSTNPFGSF